MDPIWIVAVVVAVSLVAVGLWVLARTEAPRSIAGPVPEPSVPDDEGTTLGESAAPSGRSASLLSTEVDVSVEVPTSDDEDPTGPVPLILVSAVGRTDQGRRRKHNEDAFTVASDHGLYAIADGMGGYAAGEVASQMAIDTLTKAFATGDFGGTPISGLPRRGDELVRAIQTANAAILEQARANEAQAGMGTTVVAARFSPNRQRVYIAHVGDSRVYRIRGHQLTQLTTDHTLGAAGVTGPSAAKLSRAVGVFDQVEVDLNVDEPQVGDFYLLCSDGLFKMVPENDIQQIVEQEPDLAAAVGRLVDEANARGGKDNVSVIVVRVDEPKLTA
jgi:protein phosphatase